MPDAPLPGGTVTFMFTDLEGSTLLWERRPDGMADAVARHDDMIGGAVARSGGIVVKARGEGDSVFAVFDRVTDAAKCALAVQRAIRGEAWPEGITLRIRVGIHSGEAELRDHDYFGPTVIRCARLRDVAHGGQTLLSSVAEELLRETLPAGAALEDLGTHRLKDLSRPERIYQLRDAGQPEYFPPLRSLDILPTNLPVQLTGFIGREAEIAQVRELLTTRRLVTLTGAGGVGKSRLALQVASELIDSFPDGVWLADLAPIGDPELVASQVAGAVRLRDESWRAATEPGLESRPQRPLVERLVEHLRGKTVLIVADDCEHLLGACAELAHTLLSSCPALHMLVTSREILSLTGETTYRVPSLSLPRTAPLDREDPSRSEAVRLFCDRATSVEPRFALDEANAEAVVQICRRLDGIPLAIELAAGRVKVLPPAQIAARLDDRFRLLTGGSRVGLRRQQTLRATVDWSYDLLSDPERALLRRLAVFPGSFGLESVEAVCAGPDLPAPEVLDVLDQLARKSLVAVEQSGEAARYRMLETIREYGSEKLFEAGEAERVRARHLEIFAMFAERLEPELRAPGQAARLERLDLEHDNVRAALLWAAAESDRAEAGLRLAASLVWFWMIRGYPGEGRGRLRSLLARATSAPREVRAKGLWGVALLSHRLGDYSAARPATEEALALWRDSGDRAGLAQTLHTSAVLSADEGSYRAARPTFEEALELWRALGDERGLASALGGLGYVALLEGDFESALGLHEKALAIRRAIADDWGVGTSLWSAGWVAIHLADYDRAQDLLDESLATFRRLGDPVSTARTLWYLGVLCLGRGDLGEARRVLDESVRATRAIEGQSGAIPALKDLASVALRSGDLAGAKELLDEALVRSRAAGARQDEAGALAALGRLARADARLAEAESLVRDALTILRDKGLALDVIEAIEDLAALAADRADARRASELFAAADAQRRRLGVPTPVSLRESHGRGVSAARVASPEVFERGWASGSEMTLDRATEVALGS